MKFSYYLLSWSPIPYFISGLLRLQWSHQHATYPFMFHCLITKPSHCQALRDFHLVSGFKGHFGLFSGTKDLKSEMVRDVSKQRNMSGFYIRVHTCSHTHRHIHRYRSRHVCVCVCIYVYAHTYTCMH